MSEATIIQALPSTLSEYLQREQSIHPSFFGQNGKRYYPFEQ